MVPALRRPPNVPAQPTTIKSMYLVSYNFISGVLWLLVLKKATMNGPAGSMELWNSTDSYTRWTQSLAIVEVINAALGIVRAPLFTTLMQVASRYLLVWIIAYLFPATTSASPAWKSMLVAWSITEIIRYGYFAINLSYGLNAVPKVLQWLRYNTFFVLYPVGISSECWLVWKATGPAEEAYGPYAAWALYAILGIYVPGAYILYTHMMTQRRRMIRGKQRAA